MSVARGDSPDNVASNRQKFLQEFSVSEADLAQPVQISRAGIEIVNMPGKYHNRDALITRQNGLYLSVLTADCAPVMLWSLEQPVIAAIHSGWQGSELDILGKTIHELIHTLDVSPASLSMAIGPGLCQNNFEVGPEFEAKFPKQHLDPKPQSDRFYFDNNGYLQQRALDLGIPTDQIEVLSYCTYEDDQLFYSHRRDGLKTGRMMSVIGINK